MRQVGLQVEHLNVHQRVARGGDTMFQWADVWWRTFAPKLVGLSLLTQADCDELISDLDDIAKSETDFIFCPPVFELIGIRR
jgi:hypothetical protein